jgi:hypothetical protein
MTSVRAWGSARRSRASGSGPAVALLWKKERPPPQVAPARHGRYLTLLHFPWPVTVHGPPSAERSFVRVHAEGARKSISRSARYDVLRAPAPRFAALRFPHARPHSHPRQRPLGAPRRAKGCTNGSVQPAHAPCGGPGVRPQHGACHLRTTVDHDRDVECETTVKVSDNDAHFALVIVGGSELRSTGHFGTARTADHRRSTSVPVRR